MNAPDLKTFNFLCWNRNCAVLFNWTIFGISFSWIRSVIFILIYCLERDSGLEPPSSDWKSEVITVIRIPQNLVPPVGVEPTRLSTMDFESITSTNYITGAWNFLFTSLYCFFKCPSTGVWTDLEGTILSASFRCFNAGSLEGCYRDRSGHAQFLRNTI